MLPEDVHELPELGWSGHYEMWQIGELALRTHELSACEGRHCTLHNPSAHAMNGWPMRWVTHLATMERQCSHGEWHPDPDDDNYRFSIGKMLPAHSCCGCCF